MFGDLNNGGVVDNQLLPVTRGTAFLFNNDRFIRLDGDGDGDYCLMINMNKQSKNVEFSKHYMVENINV